MFSSLGTKSQLNNGMITNRRVDINFRNKEYPNEFFNIYVIGYLQQRPDLPSFISISIESKSITTTYIMKNGKEEIGKTGYQTVIL